MNYEYIDYSRYTAISDGSGCISIWIKRIGKEPRLYFPTQSSVERVNEVLNGMVGTIDLYPHCISLVYKR